MPESVGWVGGSIPIVFLLFEFPVCVSEVFAHTKPIPADFVFKVLTLTALVFQEFFIVEDGVFWARGGDILSLKCLTQNLFCCDLYFGRGLEKVRIRDS